MGDEPLPVTPATIKEVLTQEDFEKMLCQNCGKKPEEHTLKLGNRCHKNDAVKVTYSAGRLYVDCSKCGRGIAVVQVAKSAPAPQRMFPMQDGPWIPWALAERVYEMYSELNGTNQSLEHLAERDGFGWAEVKFLCGAFQRNRGMVAYNDLMAKFREALR